MVSWVLKEWQVAITALLQGETIVLLRKGGIREPKGQFSLAARQVLLLPTLEHQKNELLKDEFRALVAEALYRTHLRSLYSGCKPLEHESNEA